MAGISLFYTSSGILVADGGAVAMAIQQRLASEIATGEVAYTIINFAEDGAPIVEKGLDINSMQTLSHDAGTHDWNGYIRDSLAGAASSLDERSGIEVKRSLRSLDSVTLHRGYSL